MSLTKIDLLISTFQDAITVLTGMKEEVNEPKPAILQEPSASTTEVYLRTEVLYPWVKLKRWCKQNNIQPVKKDHYGLMINHYPASAWLEVFGVDIQEVLYKKSFDEAS